MINKSEIYNLFLNKDKISHINKCEKGYYFNYFSNTYSLTTLYSSLFEEYVYLLELLDQTNLNNENPVLASFQKEFEEDCIYFSKLFKYLEQREV